MSRLVRFIVAGLMIISLPGSMVWAQQQGWELSFEVVARTFIVREPVWGQVTLKNASGGELPRAEFWGGFYLDGQQRRCRSDLVPDWQVLSPPTAGRTVATPVPRPLEKPGWKREMAINLGDVCNLQRRGEAVIGEHTVCYRDDASSDLRSNEACVSFVIEIPRGVNLEAYDAFGGDPLGSSQRHTGYAELLRRFPTSTYAAYAIWKKYAKGWAEVETQRTIDVLMAPYSFRTVLAPCDANGAPRGGSETRLDPTTYFRCRDAWMGLVLTNHPSAWFADEIRLRLSLDRYRLHDKDACAAGLEGLAEHGKPYVASKAAELLSAMKAKGMLEEKGK